MNHKLNLPGVEVRKCRVVKMRRVIFSSSSSPSSSSSFVVIVVLPFILLSWVRAPRDIIHGFRPKQREEEKSKKNVRSCGNKYNNWIDDYNKNSNKLSDMGHKNKRHLKNGEKGKTTEKWNYVQNKHFSFTAFCIHDKPLCKFYSKMNLLLFQFQFNIWISGLFNMDGMLDLECSEKRERIFKIHFQTQN